MTHDIDENEHKRNESRNQIFSYQLLAEGAQSHVIYTIDQREMRKVGRRPKAMPWDLFSFSSRQMS